MFSAFICANNIESQFNNLFDIIMFNLAPSFTFSSSPSSGGISDKCSDFSLIFVVSDDFSFPEQISQ